MRHGSLFSGIGGFDLAAEWMGWENIFHCEWNKFGQQVLHYYWPKAICYENICTTDFRVHRGTIDIITGGFPCQPYSSAGKRLGKEDERHLWPEMLRAIREIQPRWIVGENVRGLTNWNGGVVFDEVQSDLEAQGYEVTPFLLPACAVNAPHRRDRIWFVAYSTRSSERTNELRGIRPKNEEIEGKRSQTIYDAIRPDGFEGVASYTKSIDNPGKSGNLGSEEKENGIRGEGNTIPKSAYFSTSGDVADTEYIRLEHCTNGGQIQREKTDTKRQRYQSSLSTKTNGNGHKSIWQNFPTVSPICTGDDGLSNRLDSITFPKWRNESIKAGGNAVVPQVVLQIFKTIELYERTKNSDSNKKTP